MKVVAWIFVDSFLLFRLWRLWDVRIKELKTKNYIFYQKYPGIPLKPSDDFFLSVQKMIDVTKRIFALEKIVGNFAD